MDEKMLQELTGKAGQVAQTAADSVTARAEQLDAEAELLSCVVERVRPAIGTLASRPVVASRTWWPERTCPTTDETRADWRGLCLTTPLGPVEDHPRANEGGYGGEDLFLLPDGSWRELSYSGSWSRWQGASSSWEASPRDLSIRDVVREYRCQDLISRVAEALDRDLAGKREQAAKAARDRAEKLRALTRLLK